jgi:hypothetical protein
MQTNETLTTIYPSFVYHKIWDVDKEFNNKLYLLATEDYIKNSLAETNIEKFTGCKKNHLGHLRHNFLDDYKNDSVIKQFVKMCDTMARQYLLKAYGYEHKGKIFMMSDTFWQRRDKKQNVGINNHTHPKCDLVLTYYPKINLDKDVNESLRKGVIRCYDPANIGKRFWKINKNDFFIGGWFEVEVQESSMLLFEGYLPHDSTYFEGEERMCIPVLMDIETPTKHIKTCSDEFLKSD